MYRSLIFCLLALLLLWCSPPSGDSPDIEQRMDSLFGEFSLPGSPGCAVVVCEGGRIVFSKGYGLANVEHNVPISPATVFDIASVSKQFTAYAIAQLITEGKISAEDNLFRFFPELQIKDTLKVKHLVYHTSGLRDWPQTLAVAGWSMEDQLTYEQILRMTFLQKELNYPPGEEYSYTNTGYVLLAELVRRITGRAFHEYIQQEIYEPLGMTSSYFFSDIHQIIPRRAQSYYEHAGADTFINYADNTTAMGSSSMFSTVEDLAKWLIYLEEHADEPAVALMHQRGVLNNGDSIHYAYGIWYEELAGWPAIVHTGSWAGFRAITARFPAQQLSVAILSNYGNFDRYGYAEKVLNIFLGGREIEEDNFSEELAEKYAGLEGVYLAEPLRVFEISRLGNELKLIADGAIEHALREDSAGHLVSEEESSLTIRPLDKQRILADTLVLQRVPERAFSPEEYLGLYYSDELQATYEVRLSAGALTINNIRYDSIELQHAAGDVFKSDAWFLSRLVFSRSTEKTVNGLDIFGARVRRLHFRKVGL